MQILAAPFAGVTGDYQSIATTTVGLAGQSTISFTSIPSTFSHLQIRYMGRTARAATVDYLLVQFNSDTATNYSWHQLQGDGATATSANGTSQTYVYGGVTAGSTATANVQGIGTIDILDYANTNKFKTTRSISATDNNGSGLVELYSGNWRSTAAITSISITNFGAGLFSQYTSFALYGIRG